MQAWLDENDLPELVDVIGVVTGTRESQPNFPPADWLGREGWSGQVLVDDQANQVAGAFGLTAFPFFVVVGQTGWWSND